MDSVVAGDGWSCWWSRWRRRRRGRDGSRWKSRRWLLLQPPPQPAPASLREGQEIKKLQRDKHVEMEMKPKWQAKSELSIPMYVYLSLDLNFPISVSPLADKSTCSYSTAGALVVITV